ncbi:MAG: SH3 domain-containing protein [Anaerolineales bacterium]|nr:SH3 domain-containing protein [Anaerolineales bacterium]MDW8448131.1 SH3 domain-containing protein [Anaerolineales bacterium]
MKRSLPWLLICVLVLLMVWKPGQLLYVQAGTAAQIPTVAIPTVTSSPSIATIVVTLDQEQINVRAGPGMDYPIVGVLIAGQRVPALGRTVGGDWVQIVYPGVAGGTAWVYAPLVTIEGSLPLVEPPPTPTPRTTPTVDPTLAAQFLIEVPPTRLPTFTPPPPMVYPTFSRPPVGGGEARFPVAFAILGFGILGLFGTLLSLLRGR